MCIVYNAMIICMRANEAHFIRLRRCDFGHSVFIAFSQCFSRLLTESKQAELIHKARILIQLEKYDDAVSI